jgi:hypothetical protein
VASVTGLLTASSIVVSTKGRDRKKDRKWANFIFSYEIQSYNNESIPRITELIQRPLKTVSLKTKFTKDFVYIVTKNKLICQV